MWNHAVKFAGQLDHMVSVGRRAYGALQPALQDLGASQVHGAVMQGFKAYDKGKADTMGLHNNVQSHLNRLRSKAAPELDLD